MLTLYEGLHGKSFSGLQGYNLATHCSVLRPSSVEDESQLGSQSPIKEVEAAPCHLEEVLHILSSPFLAAESRSCQAAQSPLLPAAWACCPRAGCLTPAPLPFSGTPQPSSCTPDKSLPALVCW